MTDPLDALRGGPTNTEAPSRPTSETVLMDYSARTGNDEAHQHEGSHVFTLADSSMWAAQPGLNIVDGEIAIELEGDPRLTVIDDLASLRSGRKLHDLADRTRSADALELILELELKRPRTAGPMDRRDQRLVEKLQRRVGKAMRVPTIDTHGVAAAAQAQSAVAAA